jgi:hypothetical protein
MNALNSTSSNAVKIQFYLHLFAAYTKPPTGLHCVQRKQLHKHKAILSSGLFAQPCDTTQKPSVAKHLQLNESLATAAF